MKKQVVKKTTKRSSAENILEADLLWRVAWTYIRTVIDTAREPFLILDADLKVLSANTTFYRFFQVSKKETEGVFVYELGDGQWDIPSLRKLLEKIFPKNTFFTDYEVEHDFPGIGRRVLHLNARRIFTTGDKQPLILLAMEDITKQRELEEKLRDYAAELNAAVALRTRQLELRVQELERLNNIA